MIKVSVIVPVYNGENTICACIESLLSQSLEELEIIAVNDGSTDSTAEILASYGDRITVLTQKNAGQGAARNAGIQIAGGEYIGFVDADDTVDWNLYREMYQAAKNENCEVVQCGICDIREDGSRTERAAFSDCVEITDRADYIYRYFYQNLHTFEMCNKLVKKSFLTENGLSFGDTQKYFSEDLKLNAEMLLYLNRICFLEVCGYHYYIRSSGHFLSGKNEKIPKITALFEDVLNRPMEENTRKSLECTAALTLLLYCREAALTDPDYAKKALRNQSLRRYITTSMTYRSKPKHFLLYLLLRYAPAGLVIRLIRIFMAY